MNIPTQSFLQSLSLRSKHKILEVAQLSRFQIELSDFEFDEIVNLPNDKMALALNAKTLVAKFNDEYNRNDLVFILENGEKKQVKIKTAAFVFNIYFAVFHVFGTNKPINVEQIL